MKYLIMCAIAVLLVFSGCVDEEKTYNEHTYTVQKYTLEELQWFMGALDPIGERFWDIFRRFESQYSLTDDENKLLGTWTSFKESSTMPTLVFSPNKLFMAYTLYYDFVLKNNPSIEISRVMGEWYITNDQVKVTIYGYFTRSQGKEKDVYEYELCTPYEVDLINIQDVDPIGYTLGAFNYLPLPREISKIAKKKRGVSPKFKKDQAARRLTSIHMITDSGRPKYTYDFFNYLPIMTMRKLTGKQIAQSPELVVEVFKKFEFQSWTYDNLSIMFPEEFPKLR